MARASTSMSWDNRRPHAPTSKRTLRLLSIGLWSIAWLSLSGVNLLAQGNSTSQAIDVNQTPISQPVVQQAIRVWTKPSSVLWREQNLKQGLATLSATQDVQVFLDRRVDSGRFVNVAVGADRVDLVLQRIADEAGCKLGFLESLLYIGPTDEVAKLEMSYWRAWYLYRKQLVAGKAGGNANIAPQVPVQDLKWDRLSTPQDIISLIEREWHIEVLGKETIPYDLWDGGNYQAISLPAQLSLILGGFDLAAEPIPATNQWKLVPLKNVNAAHLSYPKNQWPKDLLTAWLEGQEAQIKEDTKAILVRGEVGSHYAIALGKYRQSQPKPKSRFENLRFTFEVANTPARDVIEAIGVQLQLKTDWQIDQSDLAEHRISLKVEQATVQQLIDELAKQSGVVLEVIEETSLVIKR
jgi:hypothetical protein